jgi:CubicO group peptidase (beta-lactamase class C family)
LFSGRDHRRSRANPSRRSCASVFEPLGVRHRPLDRPDRALTTGYHRAPDADQRELLERAGRDVPEEDTVDGYNIRGRYTYVRGRAAGAVQSTIPDMARYASALLRRGAGIVRPETFDAMVAPQWCPDERLQSMGLTFFRTPLFGRRTFGHGGGVMGGWLSMLTVLPEESLAVLVHANLFLTPCTVEGRSCSGAGCLTKSSVHSVDPAVLAARLASTRLRLDG